MNLKPPQGPPTTPTPEPAPKILTFEEFSRRASDEMNTPRQSSFCGYFAGGMLGDARRKTEHYKRFEKEHPAMAKSLCDKIQSPPYISSNGLKPFDKDLYEVYKIMRGYGVPDTVLLRG